MTLSDPNERQRSDAPSNDAQRGRSDDGRAAADAGAEQPDVTAKSNPPPKSENAAHAQDEKDAPSSGGFRAALKRHPIAFIVCGGLIVAGVIASVAWYLHARHYETTDDAFIDGRPVLVSPQVTGSIISVNVTDNQIVKVGDLLARIDPRDYRAAADQANAQVRQADANMKNIDAQIAAQDANVEQASQQVTEAEAALRFSNDENKRYQDLVKTGAGTVQRAQQASSDLKSKQASLNAAQAARTSASRQIDVLKAQKRVAAAQRDQAVAQQAQADANLGRTELRATVDGRIAKLTAAVGALATSAQSIMIVVPLDVWVTANFKESQLADMRVGQPVDISIDAFGKSFPGHVDGVQAGSGTAFSLLPAENATGNYVKVVQRIPVKITFDKRPDAELGPGMSVVPRVTVRP